MTVKLLLLFYCVLVAGFNGKKWKQEELICLDKSRKPVFYKDYDSFDQCVYTKEMLFSSKTVIEGLVDCREKEICYAGCAKGDCLAVGILNDFMNIKKTWSLRFVTVSALYLGCMLTFLWIVYKNNQIRFENFKMRCELKIKSGNSFFSLEDPNKYDSEHHSEFEDSFNDSLYS